MAKDTNIRPFKELAIGSWEIFKGAWKNYFWFYLMEMAVIITFMVIVFGSSILYTILRTGSTNVDPVQLSALGPVFFVGLLFVIPLTIGFQLSIYHSIYSTANKKSETLKESMKYGFTNIWPFFLVAVMLGFILLGGYLLLIVPGIILTVMFSMYYPAFVAEGVRGVAVLKRSKELTDGHKWTIAGRYALVFLFYIAASIVVSTLGSALGDGFKGLLDQVLAFLFTPLAIGFGFLIYQDLKTAK